MDRTSRLWGRRALVGSLVMAAVISLGVLVASATQPAPLEVASAVPASGTGNEHDHDHDHASILDHDGRFSGPGDVWPPEPRDATGVQPLDFSDEEAPTDAVLVAPDQPDEVLVDDAGPLAIAETSDWVLAELGDDYNLISASDNELLGDGKDDSGPVGAKLVFFSIARNQTVEVAVSGGAVISVDVAAASVQQPPLSEKEKYTAVEIARAHWAAVGDERLPLLDGYAILDIEADGSYHESRVAYVSFHPDPEARPELLTWIDLTTNSVLDAEVDR
ncbi:MAG: hypothetical protein AAF467_20920 [Actinomycetota bacterium]